jgi:hypothetical protein
MTITVKHKFVSTIPDSVDTELVRPSNWNDTHDLEGLGTMAEQDADNVAITGGTIDGTEIGQTDPAKGKFTDVDATGDIAADGDITAGGKITAGTGLEATTGDVVAADGKVIGATGLEATTGDVVAPDGKVTAKDDIETLDGEFKGDGAGLTGTAPELTAGKAKTVEGLVYNDTALDIPAGTVVFLKPNFTRIGVEVAETTNYSKSQAFGVTLELIPKDGGSGYVCAYGYLEGYDTSTFPYGQLLYLDPANPGKLTDSQPLSPNYIVTVANVWEVSSTGTLFVNPNNASIDDNFFIGLLKINHGGTNSEASPVQGGVAYGDGTKYVFTNVGVEGQLLQSTGLTAPIWVDVATAAVSRFSGGTTGLTPDTLTAGDITLGGVLITSNGGTGLSTYSGGDMTYWSSGTAFSKLPIGTSGYMMVSTGSAPSWDTVENHAVTGIASGTTGLTATNGSGGVGGTGAVTLGGTLSPANGGTGSSSVPTSGGVAYGNPTGGTGGTPAISTTPAGTAGQILQSNGAGAPSWIDSSTITALTIVNDIASNSLFHPTFTSATSGTVSQLEVSSPKYTYNPFLGEIQSTNYKGDFVDFRISPTATVTSAVGRAWWDSTGTLNIGMGGGNIIQQVGEEIFVYGKASASISGNTIAKAIYRTGTVGASGVIEFAPTIAGITNGDLIIGVATENISNNGFGRITSFGIVRGINTSGSTYGQTWADGDVLWYDPVGGGLTNVKPVAPNIKVSVGTVINAGSGGSGSIQVEINHGSVLGGTDANVQLTSVTNKDLLQYDSTLGYWKNAQSSNIVVTSFSAGTTGFTPNTATTGAVTLAGTLGTANGGTNNTATPTAGTVAYGDGAKITYTSAGTSGQALLSNGASAPTWGTPAGSLTITNDASSNTDYNLSFTTASSGTITGEFVDNGNLKYNPSTNRLSLKNIYLSTDGSTNATLMNTLNTKLNFGVNNLTKMYLNTNGVLHLQMYDVLEPPYIEAQISFDHTTSGGFSGINAYDTSNLNGLVMMYTGNAARGESDLGINNYGALYVGNPGQYGTAGQVLISGGVTGNTVWGGIAGGTF